MPPKKKGTEPTKKTVDKAKAKIIEDKTFGLKNKNKSNKVQKYVKDVEKQVKDRGVPKKKPTDVPKKSKAELEKEKKEEVTKLFKIVQNVPKGVDPKSILCEYFKQGLCSKGDKCKYSHDLNIARKNERPDLYTDRRVEGGPTEEDMATWTQEELEKVVTEREAKTGKKIHSDIVCKYFLDAVEQKKYGWFWVCPNGGDECPYRHALPPGYQLRGKKEEEEKVDDTPVEDLIEEDRRKLTTRTTLTLELFLKWRSDRNERKRKENEERARKQDERGSHHQMSGRQMFEFKPELFVDAEDEGAMGTEDLVAEDQDTVQETVLTVTGTSIVATIKNAGKGIQSFALDDNGPAGDRAVPIDESLFAGDDEIPDIPDEDGETGEEDGKEEEGEEEQDDEVDGEKEVRKKEEPVEDLKNEELLPKANGK
jgi:hypothetical protein